jgi:hypothetical protein
MSTQIEIGGRRMGRFRASWLLTKECFRFMKADTEILLVPIITSVLQCIVIGLGAFTLFVLGFFAALDKGSNPTWEEYGILFACYLVSAFFIAWSQGIIAHIVYTRAHGGDASLWHGVKVASELWPHFFLWSVITSTVGIILRALAERSGTLGRIVTGLLGATWAVLTYFVVPSMVTGKRTATGAIRDSALVFRRTWGETVVTNISFSLVFIVVFILYNAGLVGIAILMDNTIGWSPSMLFGLFGLLAFGLTFFALISAVFGSILRTLLYIYASENITPPNFNRELLDHMLVKRVSSVPAEMGTSVV